jgi:hypothetical protein
MSLSFAVVLLAIVSSFVTNSSAQSVGPAILPSATPGISLTIDATEETVKSGSGVKLVITLANQLDRDIVVWLSAIGAEGTYRVDVRDEKKNPPPDTKLGLLRNGHVDAKDLDRDLGRFGFTPEELVGTRGPFPFTLKAGQSFTQSLLVTSLYDMTKPGKYSIQIVKERDEGGVFAKSNTVTVAVTP